MAVGYAAALRDTRMQDIADLAGANAYIRFYDGTRPATEGAATTLVAELRGNATQFGTVTGGVLTASAIVDDSSAVGGVPTWCRILASDGTTIVCDLDVGTGAEDIVVSNGTIAVGATVSMSSLTFTEGNA